MDGLSKLAIDAKEKITDLGEDGILVTRCQNGEKVAFGILVRKYQDLVYRLIYRLLGRTPDVEDIAQEVFIRAYKGIGKFRQDATVFYLANANLHKLLQKTYSKTQKRYNIA